jgi:hypothetical protein
MACLSYLRAIMAFVRVSLVKLMHQVVMGLVPALEYTMSAVHGLL